MILTFRKPPIQHLQRRIPRHFRTHRRRRHTRKQTIRFFRHGNFHRGENFLQFRLVDFGFSDRVNVYMLDINFEVVENLVDESYGGFDGLVVEIGYLGGAVAGSAGGGKGGVGGTEHAGGNILGGEGSDGPAAVGVERGFGGADLLHEVRAESWSEEFGVVEFVGLREEGVVEGGGEVEEAVDHGTWNNKKVSQVPT